MLGLDRALYLRPAADPQSRYHFNTGARLSPFIKLLRQRRGVGNYMDLCVRLPFAPSTQNTSADLTRKSPCTEVKRGHIRTAENRRPVPASVLVAISLKNLKMEGH